MSRNDRARRTRSRIRLRAALASLPPTIEVTEHRRGLGSQFTFAFEHVIPEVGMALVRQHVASHGIRLRAHAGEADRPPDPPRIVAWSKKRTNPANPLTSLRWLEHLGLVECKDHEWFFPRVGERAGTQAVTRLFCAYAAERILPAWRALHRLARERRGREWIFDGWIAELIP